VPSPAAPRPWPATAVAALYLAGGAAVVVGSAWRHAHDRAAGGGGHALADFLAAEISGLVALAAAAFLLRRRGWARWICVAWMAFHVAMSLLHAGHGLVVHSVLLVLIALALFTRPTTAWLSDAA